MGCSVIYCLLHASLDTSNLSQTSKEEPLTFQGPVLFWKLQVYSMLLFMSNHRNPHWNGLVVLSTFYFCDACRKEEVPILHFPSIPAFKAEFLSNYSCCSGSSYPRGTTYQGCLHVQWRQIYNVHHSSSSYFMTFGHLSILQSYHRLWVS